MDVRGPCVALGHFQLLAWGDEFKATGRNAEERASISRLTSPCPHQLQKYNRILPRGACFYAVWILMRSVVQQQVPD